jgi:adenosylcobinamide-GDP ribazoletransferase
VDALLIALQFLTRIPLPFSFAYHDQALGRSPLFYPLVGLLLGALLAGLALFLQSSPTALAATLVLSAWVLLTGGLHLDGLADCADAWVGGYGDRQRSLQIMKDPASGPIAVTVLVLVLLVKWSALSALLDQQQLLPILLAPLLGRSAILLLMLTTPYVSPKGLAETLLQHLPFAAARIVLAVAILLALLTLGWLSLLAVALMILVVRQTAIKRLGGSTGDVYGAAVELSEAAALLAVAL